MKWIHSQAIATHRRATAAYGQAIAVPGRCRSGFSLLEIVLALAIAAVAMSLLAQLVRIGNRSAAGTRDQSQAQMVAKGVMAEVVSGVMFDLAGGQLPSSIGSTPWDPNPDWSYQVEVMEQPAANPDASMSIVTVSVSRSQDISNTNAQAAYSITQWLFVPPPPEEEEEEEDAVGTDGAGV